MIAFTIKQGRLFKVIAKNNFTFAIVTRLQKSETPYLNEFLEYYKHIGINRFYLINTELDNHKFIMQTISAEFKDMVSLLNQKEEDEIKGCQNMVLPMVKETFLLNLDMDEFLYLDGMTLNEFAESEHLERYENDFLECAFHWVMTPLCDELYASSIRSILEKKYFFPSKQTKTMYYTKDIIKIREHENILKAPIGMKKNYKAQTNNCFIFHVSSRGVMDIINKIQFTQFKDLKESQQPQSELNELIFNTSSSFLPSRFILLAFQNRFEPYLIECNFNYPKLTHQTDTALLSKLTLNGLKNLLNRDVFEKDLKHLIYDKMHNYAISSELIKRYANEQIGLMRVIGPAAGKGFSYHDFLELNDDEFINELYTVLLQREADEVEFNHLLSLLQSGAKNKSEIISILRYSKEGKEKNIKISGSKKRHILTRLYSIPVICHFTKFLVSRMKNYST